VEMQGEVTVGYKDWRLLFIVAVVGAQAQVNNNHLNTTTLADCLTEQSARPTIT